jgi:DNA-binding NarL/FixJ family response regulator
MCSPNRMRLTNAYGFLFFSPYQKNTIFHVHIIYNIDSTTSIELGMTTFSKLTRRELEILQLVLAGYTNKAIAAEMFISEKTVEFHLGHIYTKIGVRTRLLAGIWAIQHNVLIETREIPS